MPLDSEVPLFDHVERRDVPWDGHSTEAKYARVEAAIRRLKGGEGEG